MRIPRGKALYGQVKPGGGVGCRCPRAIRLEGCCCYTAVVLWSWRTSLLIAPMPTTVAACSRKRARCPYKKRAHLRAGASARHPTDAAHPQLEGSALPPAGKNQPVCAHRPPVHGNGRLGADRGPPARHAARRALDQGRPPAAVSHSAPARDLQPEEPVVLRLP